MPSNALSLKSDGRITPPPSGRASARAAGGSAAPSLAQRRYLNLGLEQPGGKLPLFDRTGQKIPAQTIRACMTAGWCEPWFANPVEPKWLVCKLTNNGRTVAGS